MPHRTLAVNEAGLRIGEDHQNAKLTNREVDQIRELHESGVGYRRLGHMFDVARGTVRDIVKCRRRAQTPAGFRTVAG